MMLRCSVYLWDHGFGQNVHDDGSIEQSRSDSTFVRCRFQFDRPISWKKIRSFAFFTLLFVPSLLFPFSYFDRTDRIATKFNVKPIFYSNDNAKKFKWLKMVSVNVPSLFGIAPANGDGILLLSSFRTTETSAPRTLDSTSIWNPQLNENCSYFVFVTFVEIYNNYIYDLFDDDILNK